MEEQRGERQRQGGVTDSVIIPDGVVSDDKNSVDDETSVIYENTLCGVTVISQDPFRQPLEC